MLALDPLRWRELSALLDQTLELSADQRQAFVASLRGRTPELAALLEESLASHSRLAAERFLEAGPDLPDLPVVHAGQAISAYTLERLLGVGGMGAVWLGRRSDGRFDGYVAIKLLNLARLDGLGQEHFRREGTVLARLSHPNIARLLDAGVSPAGQPYLVLEYVKGLAIDAYADACRLSVAARIRLFLAVLDAVGHAHRHLIVHRDLKPSNILVEGEGMVKLLDFGIAKLLAAGTDRPSEPLTRDGRALTPEFAAPEQVRGAPITVATDVYSLGVLLYALLCGRPPYDLTGRSVAEIERLVCERTPLKPSAAVLGSPEGDGIARARATTPARLRRRLRGDLDTIVMKALRHEPERRYTTTAELREELSRFLSGHAVLARPDSPGYRMRRFAGRHRAGVAMAVAVLALVVGAVVRERTLRERAEAEAAKAKAVEQYLVSVFDAADPFASLPPGGSDISARALLDRGAAQVEASLQSQPALQAELRSVLGGVYVSLGGLDRAEPLLRAALAQQRALHGEVHADVAAAMAGLGDLLRQQSRFDEAEPLLREALGQRRRLLGNTHPDTAESLGHLGTLLQERTAYPEAEVLFREAVAVRRRLAADDEWLAVSLNDLGLLLYLKARAPESEALYREALDIFTRRLRADHPRIAQTAQNLAQTLQETGQLDEAELLYRRSLDTKRKALGDAHPSVTIGLNNLAQFLAAERGKYDEAEALARQALALDRQIFAAPHAYIAESLRRVGTVLRLKGDYAGAEQFGRQALAMNQLLFGAEHLRIASSLNLIASALHGSGKLTAAIALFRESLAQFEHLVGRRHVNYVTVSNNLAAALRDRGEIEEATGLYRDIVDHFEGHDRTARRQAAVARAELQAIQK